MTAVSFNPARIGSRIRRNHGLEHATIHMLSARVPGVRVAGISDPGGFHLIGNVTLEQAAAAATEAQDRLHKGQHDLAIHPNCGTNFVTAGFLAGAAAMVAMFNPPRTLRGRVERFPLLVVLVTLAVIVARPLGLRLQREVTTSGDLGDLRVTGVYRRSVGPLELIRVTTAGD